MNREQAERLLCEAAQLNPGAWVEHSRIVAALAEKNAAKAGLDRDRAYCFGLLHDIGRRGGTMQARHAIEGYRFLSALGFQDAARICMTHTFQFQNADAIYDTWDCTAEEKEFVKNYLDSIVYDDYDRLIQLCDALSTNVGNVFAEQKMVSSVMKFGFRDTTLQKWQAILDLKVYFDAKTGIVIYKLF